MKIKHCFSESEISIIKGGLIGIAEVIGLTFKSIVGMVIFVGITYLTGKCGAWLQINHNLAFIISISVLTTVLTIFFWFMVYCLSQTKADTKEHEKFYDICIVLGLSLSFLIINFILISYLIPKETPVDSAVLWCSLVIIAPCFCGWLMVIATSD